MTTLQMTIVERHPGGRLVSMSAPKLYVSLGSERHRRANHLTKWGRVGSTCGVASQHCGAQAPQRKLCTAQALSSRSHSNTHEHALALGDWPPTDHRDRRKMLKAVAKPSGFLTHKRDAQIKSHQSRLPTIIPFILFVNRSFSLLDSGRSPFVDNISNSSPCNGAYEYLCTRRVGHEAALRKIRP
jgi:hypothetical protein